MKHLNNQRGFSLIEIMVALVLGLTLVIAFTGALIVGLQTEGDMDERLYSRRISDDIVEHLRNNRQDFEESDWENNVNKEFEEDIKIIEQIDYDENQDYNEDIDIVIVWNKSDNLYEFVIDWNDKNYKTEAVVAGEIQIASGNGGNGNASGDNGNDNDNGNDKTLEHYGTLGNTIELKLNPDSVSVNDFDISTDKETCNHLEIDDETITKNSEHNLFEISYVFDGHPPAQSPFEAKVTYSLVGSDASITLEIEVNSDNDIVSIEEI